MIAKPLVVASLAVLSWSSLLPAASAAQLIVQVAPPPPRVEVVPAPRRGMVWSPGHWEWRHQRHVWVEGHWVKARPGYVYAQPEWRQANGRWAWQAGHWHRGDRDGDGVPNRHDRRPDNPYRH